MANIKIKRKDIFVVELNEHSFQSLHNILEVYGDCQIESLEMSNNEKLIPLVEELKETFDEAWKHSQELYEGVQNA